jgi:hypothetical protein
MTLTEDQQQAVQHAIRPLEKFQREAFMNALDRWLTGPRCMGDGELPCSLGLHIGPEKFAEVCV